MKCFYSKYLSHQLPFLSLSSFLLLYHLLLWCCLADRSEPYGMVFINGFSDSWDSNPAQSSFCLQSCHRVARANIQIKHALSQETFQTAGSEQYFLRLLQIEINVINFKTNQATPTWWDKQRLLSVTVLLLVPFITPWIPWGKLCVWKMANWPNYMNDMNYKCQIQPNISKQVQTISNMDRKPGAPNKHLWFSVWWESVCLWGLGEVHGSW